MKVSLGCIAVLGVVCLLVVASSGPARDTVPPYFPRAVPEDSADERAKEYRTQFEKVGRAGLQALTKSKDTSLALQASWEHNKKIVNRTVPFPEPKNPGGLPADTYDPAGVGQFLDFLKMRTTAPVPEWWAKGLSDLSVEKAEWNGRIGLGRNRMKMQELEIGDINWRVQQGAELTLGKEGYGYKSGNTVLAFVKPKAPGGRFAGNAVTHVKGTGITCYAFYNYNSAISFKIVGLDNRTEKILWDADVWARATRRYVGAGSEHYVELAVKGDTVFVFGEDVAGLYVEAFDINKGGCQFRFCTSYWGNYSEKWSIK